jgi:S1-C subfamily serine protease
LTLNNTIYAQTAQEIARKAFKSTVLLVMEDANGQPMTLGSGFFVRNGEIVSNLHVVKGASRGYAKIVGQNNKYNIEGITGIDLERDLVILKISTAKSLSLSIGNSDMVEVGEQVYAVGNPQGLEGTFSQGIVSSIRQVGSDKLLQITAPISPGSSGGPVLNSNGVVVGVSVATFRDGQNLNFAIPSNYIKDLLSNTRTVRPLASTKSPMNQPSILADLGGRSSEGVIGQNFTYDDPPGAGGFGASFYSFSLVNKLREPVKDIHYLVVFYDLEGNSLDAVKGDCREIIASGLAKRVRAFTEGSVRKLNEKQDYRTLRTQRGNIEIRILDFKIVH